MSKDQAESRLDLNLLRKKIKVPFSKYFVTSRSLKALTEKEFTAAALQLSKIKAVV